MSFVCVGQFVFSSFKKKNGIIGRKKNTGFIGIFRTFLVVALGDECISYGTGSDPDDNCADPNSVCDGTATYSCSLRVCVCLEDYYNPLGCQACGGSCEPSNYTDFNICLIIRKKFSYYKI